MNDEIDGGGDAARLQEIKSILARDAGEYRARGLDREHRAILERQQAASDPLLNPRGGPDKGAGQAPTGTRPWGDSRVWDQRFDTEVPGDDIDDAGEFADDAGEPEPRLRGEQERAPQDLLDPMTVAAEFEHLVDPADEGDTAMLNEFRTYAEQNKLAPQQIKGLLAWADGQALRNALRPDDPKKFRDRVSELQARQRSGQYSDGDMHELHNLIRWQRKRGTRT